MASKRGKKAPVWTYMEQTTPNSVTCLICKDTLKYSGGSTSNLIKHIRGRHPVEHAELKEESANEMVAKASKPSTSQPTLMETVTRTQPYKKESKAKKEVDELVMEWIVKDLMPLSSVESKAFKKLLKRLDPKYELPSRREIGRTLLPALYNKEVERVREELEEAAHVALTTDLWTSRQTKGYITVTAHYITSEWVLKSAVLETTCIVGSHTAENIAQHLREICDKWNIFDKVRTIVTDNAANITAAIQKLNKRQIPCFAHTLNLVVQEAIKNTPDVLDVRDKIKQIVAFFHHSVKATDKLTQLQEQNNEPVKKLIQDVETRWNSTFYMIERFLEQNELVTTTLCLLGKNNLCLSDNELALLQRSINVLEIFEEATREMSSEKVTSISKVLPMIRGLQTCLNSVTMMDDMCELGQQLQEQMKRRFSTVEGSFSLAAATMLDPRFKKVPFSDSSNAKTTEERLVQQMRSYDTPKPASQPSTSHEAARTFENRTSLVKKSSLWSTLDKDIEKINEITSSQSLTGPHIEMRRFFTEETHASREEDPLMWWKEHAAQYPRLKELAKKYLCSPASSVPSERLFSKAGELISLRRSNLSENKVNMILFLNKNL